MIGYRVSLLYIPFLLLIDIIGYVLFFWLKLRPWKEPKRILLIRLEHIGDVLLTTPAFRALRQRFPHARIDVLVRDFAAPILRGNKSIDRVIVWNAPWLSSTGRWRTVLPLVKRLRREQYDLAIDFHGDPRNTLLAGFVAQYRVGFGVRGLGFVLNRVVQYGVRHVIDRNLALARALGADARGREMELHISQADISFATKVFKRARVVRAVCFAPGAGPGREKKLWVAARWAQLANQLVHEKNARVIFLGSSRDVPLVNSILTNVNYPKKMINLCGKTTIHQAAAVVQQSRLVIGIDGAPLHIARTMKTPLIGIFTAENPREWGYNEPRFTFVKKPRQMLRVEDVLAKVRQLRIL